MKSNKDRAFLISIAVAFVVGLLLYFLMIAPNQSSTSKNLRKINKNKKDTLSVSNPTAREFDALFKSYTEKNDELTNLRKSLLAELSFEMPEDFSLDDNTPANVQFPIVKTRTVAALRESYPGFPFASSLGFPDLPDVSKKEYLVLFEKLAIVRRLLIIFGEAGVNSVKSFKHPANISIRSDKAKATITKNRVSVTFEGSIRSILTSLKKFSSKGKYLFIESISIHASPNGYALECDLTVSVISVAFDAEDEYSSPPVETNTNTPLENTPHTIATPAVKPTPKKTPTKSSTTNPKRTRNNPAGW